MRGAENNGGIKAQLRFYFVAEIAHNVTGYRKLFKNIGLNAQKLQKLCIALFAFCAHYRPRCGVGVLVFHNARKPVGYVFGYH